MSDSQLSADQPVYPGDKPSIHGNEAKDEQEVTQTPENDQSPNEDYKIEVGGKSYTEEEIQEALLGGMKDADYRKKTQALAEQRRALEEREREIQEMQEQMAQGSSSDDNDDDDYYGDPFDQRISGIENKLNKIYERFQSQEEAERARQQQEQEVEQLSMEIDQFSGKPLFNRTKILEYMAENELGVGQVGVAYQALFGSDLGKSLGEAEALKRYGGVTPMGSSGTNVSPGFTHPTDIQGFDFNRASDQDVLNAALNDPRRPKG